MSEHPLPLAGKVALVTAASRTLGAAIASGLAQAGAQTAIHYFRSRESAESLASQLRAHGLQAQTFGADGQDPAQVRALAAAVSAAWGGVDILVNNLGPYTDTPLLALPETEWDWILTTHLKAPHLLVQALAPGMRARGWGRIINISAVSAFIRSHSVFGLAKQALIYLTEAWAVELAPQVTVNAIAPGQIEDSELIDTIDPDYKRVLRAQSPLGRLVTRQEITDVIIQLCAGPFGTFTGQTLRLDAGWTLPVWDYHVGAVEGPARKE
jgi:NAD(P)-dependent dehydrogenase (short-subunit alcohol dehydrogenase family)